MPDERNFTITINLSNFFNDHRHRARIFINEKISTVQDLKNKILSIFNIENFALISQNEYLPATEDIRILRKDEIVWAIPVKELMNYSNTDNNISSPIEKRKRKKSTANIGTDKLNNYTEHIETINNKKQKKCSENKIVNNEFRDNNNDEFEVVSIEKKKVKQFNNTEELNDKTKITKKEKEHHLSKSKIKKTKKNEEDKDHSENLNFISLNVNVGNSISKNLNITKKSHLPTITDEYLKEKPINIVKILQKTSTGINEYNKQENIKETLNINDSEGNVNESNPKATRFFFLPSEKDKEKIHKMEKRINFFKMNNSNSTTSNATDNVKETTCTNSKATEAEEQVQEVELGVGTKTDNIELNNSSTPKIEIIDIKHYFPANDSLTLAAEKKYDKESYIEETTEEFSEITKDNSEKDFGDALLSGIEFLEQGISMSKKQIAGVGELLDKLRKNESTESLDTLSINSDGGEFVTKRKRHRVRKRKSKRQSESNHFSDAKLNEIEGLSSSNTIPKMYSCPKSHIKFPEDNILNKNNENILSEKNMSEDLNGLNELKDITLNNILEAPIMNNIEPKPGNIIAFKILKISENFTPEISTHIIGYVKSFSKDTKQVALKIIDGLDEFIHPQGKLMVGNEDMIDETCHQEINWTKFIEPRLLNH